MSQQTLTVKINAEDAIEQITSPTIAMATRVMIEQRDKGIAKYGQPLEEANLSVHGLVRHAQEEAADLSVYLAQLTHRLSQDADEVLRVRCLLVGLMSALNGKIAELRGRFPVAPGSEDYWTDLCDIIAEFERKL